MTSIPEFCYDVVICNHDKLFETIKEATEYCDHHDLPKEIIRQFERHEEYDEDGFMTDNYNMDDWTYPLKKKNKKKKKIKLVIKEEEEEVDISCIESELDNMLYQENMDWSFDKPTKGKYETIYIIKREEEEE